MFKWVLFWLFWLGVMCTRIAGDKRRVREWGWGCRKLNEFDW